MEFVSDGKKAQMVIDGQVVHEIDRASANVDGITIRGDHGSEAQWDDISWDTSSSVSSDSLFTVESRDCAFTPWSAWSRCTRGCGTGTQKRIRSIAHDGTGNGMKCPKLAKLEESRTCMVMHCPVDCVMSNWTAWSECSADCGEGEQTRSRSVTTVAKYRGEECPPTHMETRKCTASHECGKECKVSEWSAWSECDAECGPGKKIRSRAIISKGNQCKPALMESSSCQIKPCPIDCKWAAWGDWSPCSKTCGDGVEMRSRFKDSVGKYGGEICSGQANETRACNLRVCKDGEDNSAIGKETSEGVWQTQCAAEVKQDESTPHLSFIEVEEANEESSDTCKVAKTRKCPHGSGEIVNVGVGSTASQSSTNLGGGASRAVDSNTEGEFKAGSVSFTKREHHAWWQTDLGAIFDVQKIRLHSRTDCPSSPSGCFGYLDNIYVMVSDQPFDSKLDANINNPRVWMQHVLKFSDNGFNVLIPGGFRGRYVRVQSAAKHTYLMLAEVEVMAYKNAVKCGVAVEDTRNFANNGAVVIARSNNPLVETVDLQRLVDGNTVGDVLAVPETEHQKPWVEVDLGKFYYLNELKLFFPESGQEGIKVFFSAEKLDDDLSIEEASAHAMHASPENPEGSADEMYQVGQLPARAFTVTELGCKPVRYIRVMTSSTVLRMTELQAWGKDAPKKTDWYIVNLARGKEARQSSTIGNAVAGLAVDAETSTHNILKSVAMTNKQSQPWWEVDLGAVYDLEKVIIRTRSDCANCLDNLKNSYIMTSDQAFSNNEKAPLTINQDLDNPRVWRHYIPVAFTDTLTVLAATKARYVRIQSAQPVDVATQLMLADVEVFGDYRKEYAPRVPLYNLALQKRVTLSSHANNRIAPSALLDGNTHGATIKSVPQRGIDKATKDAFMQVDLGSQHLISYVKIFGGKEPIRNLTLVFSDIKLPSSLNGDEDNELPGQSDEDGFHSLAEFEKETGATVHQIRGVDLFTRQNADASDNSAQVTMATVAVPANMHINARFVRIVMPAALPRKQNPTYVLDKKGKFTKVQRTLYATEALEVGEIEVWGDKEDTSGLVNVAEGSVVTASSNANNVNPSIIVDGLGLGEQSGGLVTASGDRDPFVELDLGKVRDIQYLRVALDKGRNENLRFMNNFYVIVSEKPLHRLLDVNTHHPAVFKHHFSRMVSPDLKVHLPRDVHGRYVRVQMTGYSNARRALRLLEVEAWAPKGKIFPAKQESSLADLALGRPATMSTVEGGANIDGVKFATDGYISEAKFAATSIRPYKKHPAGKMWWQVDLGATFDLKEVKVFNRHASHCEDLTYFKDHKECTPRLRDFTVRISKSPMQIAYGSSKSSDACSQHIHTLSPDGVASIRFTDGARGRFVRIEVDADSWVSQLALNEVQVWGFPHSATMEVTNVAETMRPTASQSSNARAAVAAKATDGNVDGSFSHGSVSHTDHDFQAWWQTDLEHVHDVRFIKVWPRTDCKQCLDYLKDSYVMVSEQPFTSKSLDVNVNNPAVWSQYISSVSIGSGHIAIPVHARGRYVRIQSSHATYIMLSEVEVYADKNSHVAGPHLTDIALDRPVIASSSVSDKSQEAALVVNGYTDPKSMMSTVFETDPWVQIELPSLCKVQFVKVFAGEREMRNLVVSVSSHVLAGQSLNNLATLEGVWSDTIDVVDATYMLGKTVSSYAVVSVPNVEARYVRVGLSGHDALQLSEVMVFGDCEQN